MCSKQCSSNINCCQTEDQIRKLVRENYAKIVTDFQSNGCAENSGSCFASNTSEEYAQLLGYTDDEIKLSNDANLGLGCGNPALFAKLKPGETVLDIGSGAGFDAFIASRAVGQTGRVIGVDMTPEMVDKARQNAIKYEYTNVEFRLGEIEYLPIADSCIDVIISNCVINLVPNKAQVFREAFRVLRCGGRISISDVVTNTHLPDSVRNDLALFAGCLAGATLIEDMRQFINNAGFVDVKITPKEESRQFIANWSPNSKLEHYVVSALIEANKP